MADEYRQVAALLAWELDMLREVANDTDTSAEELRDIIRDVVERKDQIVSNREHRERQFAALHTIASVIANQKPLEPQLDTTIEGEVRE